MAFANKIGGLIKNAINSTPSIYQSIRCMSSAKLFVGGISWSTDDNSLKDAFGSFGDVVEARVIVDRETGRSRGFGFVTFASTEEASNALSAMDQKELHGRVIRVNYANDRSRGGGGFGGGGYGGGYGGGGYGGGGYGGGGGSYSGGGGYDGGSGGGGSYSGGGGYDGGSGGSMYSGGGGGVGDGGSYGGSSGVSSFGSSGSGAYAGNDSYGSGSSAGARGSFDKDDGLDLIKDDAYEPDDDYANKREN